MPELLVEWGLFGAPRLGPMGRFASVRDLDGMDSRLGMAYAEALREIGEWYKDEVGRRFNETHGRTGATAESMEGQGPHIESSDLATYAVAVGGTIWSVIKPLPGHYIGAPGMNLFGPTPAPEGMRSVNLYAPFQRYGQVFWFQNGPDAPESHSPDTSWYTDAKEALYAQAQKKLFGLASIVQQQWTLGNAGRVPWSRGEAITSWRDIESRSF